jgi:hypothetical protein
LSTFAPTDGFSSISASRTRTAISPRCGREWPADCWRLRVHCRTGCASSSSRAIGRRPCSAHISRSTWPNCALAIPPRRSKSCSARPAGTSRRRTSLRTVRARRSTSPSQPMTALSSTWEPASTRTQRSPMVRASPAPTRSAPRPVPTGMSLGGRWRQPVSSTTRPSGGTGPTVTATGLWPPARRRHVTAR